MDKYIGRLLDNRYEILEVIGTGGMAVVYKARCHRLNRLVAIKILKDDFMQDEDFRRRFHSESQAVAMLSHPNIVSVYDVSTSIMADYIVMELIEGISLKQYMEKKGCLNWKETLHFAIQIGKALEHAHSRGIVHRDIKPHNIMVLKNGSVKVTDFGIARMMSKGNTLTKEALGSVHYITPEQAKGGRVDNRSDIYSLGIVMYEMMSGRPPYDGESPVAVAIQHINGGAVMPSIYNPNIPGGLEQIIMKAMAHDQAKRYTSATEMLRDMDEFRKDPAILFDYNTPKEDVIKIHRPTMVIEPLTNTPKTTAEKVVERTGGAEVIRRTRPTRQEPQRRQPEQPEKRNNTAIIAIIVCAVVALIALSVFLVVILSGDGGAEPAAKTVEVPNFVGKYYETLSTYSEFDLEKFKIETEDGYSDEYEPGMIMFQKPAAFTEVKEGSRVILTISQGKDPNIQDTTEATQGGTEAPSVEMEDLVEMTEDKARNTLMQYDFYVEVIPEKAFDDKVPAGCVISTKPAKGEPLREGDKVTLVISAGKQPRMEDFVGKDGQETKNALLNMEIGLEVEIENEFHDEIEAGKVISTDPAEGKFLDFGDKVVVVVSKGPEMVAEVLPAQIVGKDVTEAANILKSKGFETYITEETDSDEPQGTVVGYYVQNEPGMDLTKPVYVTSVIVLKVSKGPQYVSVTKTILAPDVDWLNLKLGENYGDIIMTVWDGEELVHQKTVVPGENVTVTFKGTGRVTYEIRINGVPYSENYVVDFDYEKS